MPAGRPRTVSLPPDEMIKLGEKMIKWVVENDPVHLSEFYCIHMGYTDSEWDTMHVAPEFFPYYEKALKLVGIKYLRKDTDIEPSLKHRWQRVYFKDLKHLEDDDFNAEYSRKLKLSEAEMKLKQEVINNLPEDLQDQVQALLKQISEAQSSFKIEDSKRRAETKS